MRKSVAMLLSLLMLALVLPATAAASDRDGDRLPDRWEKRHGLSLEKKSRNADRDRDRVDNGNEYREHTNPRDADSDGDGKGDGREDSDRDALNNRAEDATGNDPRDKDTDDGGVLDGREQAGVIVSFEEGVLTIDLSNGGSLNGLVNEYTDLSCRSEAEEEKSYRGGEDGEKVTASTTEEGEPHLEEQPPNDEELGDEPKSGEEEKHREKQCTADDLKPGGPVHEARLLVDFEGAWFKSIALLR